MEAAAEGAIGAADEGLRLCRLLRETSAAASSTSTPSDALRVALEQICATLGWPAGHVCWATGEGHACLDSSELWALQEADAFPSLRELRDEARSVHDIGLPGLSYATKRPVCTTELGCGVGVCKDEALWKAGVAWSFALPVIDGSEPVAVLEFFSNQEEHLDEGAVEVLVCIGIQLGNIVQRQRAIEQLEHVRRDLVATSQRAGTADIATRALHNVGNVLNSVNVAASTICEKVRRSGTADLKRAAGILQEHQHDFADFATVDERGKHLPRFLIELSRRIETEEEAVLSELTTLIRNIDHIKDVVSVQQSYSSMSGTEAEASAAELLEDSIRINFASLERHQIQIVREFADVPPMMIAKQKLLQIMVNLISNAKYALIDADIPDRRISLRLSPSDGERVRIEVEDNGMGISPENLSKLFSFGFTTRKEGHGYGLHSAAELAAELGGRLEGYSEGVGRGARFVLDLPVNAKKTPIHG